MSNIKVLDTVIGKGSFGVVHLGIDNNKMVAVKTESKKCKKTILNHEFAIIRSLRRDSFRHGINRFSHFWEDECFCYLAIDLMGPNLDSLHRICGRSFTIKTTLMIMSQMIDLMKFYHQQGIIHRDIKPANFLIEYNLPHRYISLVDFGLAKKFMIKGKQIPYNTGTLKVGSMRYMSKHIHHSIEASPRDDMYSVGYCIIYLFTGMLPWQGEHINKMSKSHKKEYISKLKANIPNRDLVNNCSCFHCSKINIDCCFMTYMQEYFDYLDSLDYESIIDYNMLTSKISHVMKQHGYKIDYDWDWNKFYMLSESTGI